jgi:hypothetical protein
MAPLPLLLSAAARRGVPAAVHLHHLGRAAAPVAFASAAASFASAAAAASAPAPPPTAVELSLRTAYSHDPAAATAAVLRALSGDAQGRSHLLEALRRQHQQQQEPPDLELGRRSALRFGGVAAPAAQTPSAAARAEAAADRASTAAESAEAAEAAASRAEAAAAESAAAVSAAAHQHAAVQEEAAASRAAAAAAAVAEPSFAQLSRVAFAKGVPFIFFGFFDNALMITGGGALEEMIGARFGLSVLACSGLANTFADVGGLHISHVVEDRYKRSGWARLALAPEQNSLPSVRRAKWVGAAAGVATGCLLGLTPLAFMNQPAIVAASVVAEAVAQQ